jgi:hypothetical protein
MLRGVPLGNAFRQARLVRAYYDEKNEDYASIMALVYASFQNQETSERIHELGKKLFPDGQAVEDFAKRGAEQLEKHAEHFSNPLFASLIDREES